MRRFPRHTLRFVVALALCWSLAAPVFVGQALAAPALPAQAPIPGFAERQANLDDPKDGSKVRYVDSGQGEAAVVFVHGWACRLEFWRPQMLELAGKRRVVALDLPGMGGSDAPAVDYTQDRLAEGLAAVLDHAGVRRAVLVVHSMGLTVAKRYMERHPGRVAGLFIVDGAFVDLPRDEARAAGFRAKAGDPALDSDAAWRGFVAGFVAPMFSPATPRQAREDILATMAGTPRHVARSALLGYLSPGTWTASPESVPVLAVYSRPLLGQREQQVRQALGRAFPGLRLELWDGVGHFIMADAPERLSRAVADFATGLLP